MGREVERGIRVFGVQQCYMEDRSSGVLEADGVVEVEKVTNSRKSFVLNSGNYLT